MDHLRNGEPALQRLLRESQVLAHPGVIGELALGQLRQRQEIIGLLGSLPGAAVTTPVETPGMIDRFRLSGRGIGYVDVPLLAAVRLTADAEGT